MFPSDNVYAMSPVLPDDSVILTLPFGGAVLQKMGISKPEIDAVLEDFRYKYIDEKELSDDTFDFLNSFRRRLPPSSLSNEEEQLNNDISDIESKGLNNNEDETNDNEIVESEKIENEKKHEIFNETNEELIDALALSLLQEAEAKQIRQQIESQPETKNIDNDSLISANTNADIIIDESKSNHFA